MDWYGAEYGYEEQYFPGAVEGYAPSVVEQDGGAHVCESDDETEEPLAKKRKSLAEEHMDADDVSADNQSDSKASSQPPGKFDKFLKKFHKDQEKITDPVEPSLATVINKCSCLAWITTSLKR